MNWRGLVRRVEEMTECLSRASTAWRPDRLPRAAARVAGLVALALLLAACGDDGEETTDGSPPGEINISLDGEPAGGGEPAVDPPVAPPAEPAEEPAEPAAPDAEAPAPAESAAAPVDPAGAPVPEGDDPAAAGAEPSAAVAEAQLAAFAAEEPALPPAMAALIADADADAGRSYAQRCTGCHSFQAGRPARTEPQVGPSLYGVVDRRIGTVDDYDYSEALLALGRPEPFGPWPGSPPSSPTRRPSCRARA